MKLHAVSYAPHTSPCSRRRLVPLHIRNQPHPRLRREISVRPLEQHHEPISEPDEIHDVDEQPEDPRKPAGESYPAQVSDGARSSDGRQISLVPVAERLARLPPQL